MADSVKYSKKMLDAYLATVRAYEQAIYDIESGQESVEDVMDRWSEYGNYDSCRLCRVVGIEHAFCEKNGCIVCVLGPAEDGCNRNSSFTVLLYSSRSIIYKHRFLSALKRRLRWIIKKAESNGVYLED